MALGFESLVRHFVMPAELAEIRGFFAPMATTAAWVFAAACILADGLGMVLQRRWCLARMELARADGSDLARAAMDRTFLAMSVPQVPAILATAAFMSGSELVPVLVAMAISSVGVVAQGLQWEALLARARH